MSGIRAPAGRRRPCARRGRSGPPPGPSLRSAGKSRARGRCRTDGRYGGACRGVLRNFGRAAPPLGRACRRETPLCRTRDRHLPSAREQRAASARVSGRFRRWAGIRSTGRPRAPPDRS